MDLSVNSPYRIGLLAFAFVAANCVSTPRQTESLTVDPEPSANQPLPQPVAPEPQADAAQVFPETVAPCAGMAVKNAPSDTYSPIALISGDDLFGDDGVPLAIAPIENGCLSSGMGFRRRSLHKGIDFNSRTPATIYAAGDGVVREVAYRRDYGYMVVIDHGDHVFTRYAHLEWTPPWLQPGMEVRMGAPIARMGQTGRATARHLHYEVLLGDYDTPKRSFGLKPIDPFDYPRRQRPAPQPPYA